MKEMKIRKTTGVGIERDAPGRVRVKGPLSQEQVAALFRCTRGNIHMIERRALRKMRGVIQ